MTGSMGRYDEILRREYTGVARPQKMSMEQRAAQFAPFAALSGHDAALRETARLTSRKIELSDDEYRVLSGRLNMALAHMREKPVLTFTVFRPDRAKAGGCYVRVTGVIKKVDEYNQAIVLADNQALMLDDILIIEGEMFDDEE